MEKAKAYIYNLSPEKDRVMLTIGSVTPLLPSLPLKDQKAVKITGGYRIENWGKTYQKTTWYQTDKTLILPDRDDEEAFQHFKAVLGERSKKAIDELIISEQIVDAFCANYKKGKLIWEKK